MNKETTLSVVIPCYNEKDSIQTIEAKSKEEFDLSGYHVFVYDGDQWDSIYNK